MIKDSGFAQNCLKYKPKKNQQLEILENRVGEYYAFRYNTCKPITKNCMSFFDFNFSLMIGFPRFIIRISPAIFPF
jgi:hypothetical protein